MTDHPSSSPSGRSRFVPRAVFTAGFSFRVGLVALVILNILVAVAVVTWLSFAAERRAVRELAVQLHREVAFRIQQHLTSFLETPQIINAINTDLVGSGLLDTGDWRALERYFWRQGLEFKGVGTIAFGSADGGFVGANAAEGYVVTTESAGGRVIRRYACDGQGRRGELLLEPTDEYDARLRAWYRAALKAGKPTWTDVTVSLSRRRLDLSAVNPCYDADGRLLGVFLVDVALSQIGGFLSGLDIGKSGHAFIVDAEGFLVATSSGERPFRRDEQDGFVERIRATKSDEQVIRQAAARLVPRLGDVLNSRTGVDLRLKGEGGYSIAHSQVVTALQEPGGLDWFLVVVVPERELIQRLEPRTRATITLLAGVAVLVALVGGLTARWFVQPLLRINAAAKEIASGALRPSLAVSRKGELGELATSLGLITDQLQAAFTELRQANQDLELHKEQLRSMASEMCLTEEKERRRIASEVHDRVIQALIVAKMRAASVRGSIVESNTREEFGEMEALLQEAIQEARALLLELSPPVLYELGLVPAVEWLGERLALEHDIACNVSQQGQPIPLDLDLQIVLFQAARELLANIGKHAGATEAIVVLRWGPTFVVMTVQDDGIGFDPLTSRAGRPDRHGGFGLFSISERLHLLGGEIDIGSTPGSGTRITLRVPVVVQEEIS